MDKTNFVSIQSKYWNLINEEIEYDRKNEEAYMQGSDIFSTKEHSELYYKLLREEFIKESFDEEEGITTHDLNISSPFLASILNLEGVYMIADTIIQSTPTTLKYWINGDINNLSRLLNTDENSSDIQIFKLTSTKKSSFYPNPKQGPWANPTNDPKRKIKLYLYFETWQYLGDGTIWRYQHYVNVKSEKKNWRGQWRSNWTIMYVKGSWSGDFQYTDPYNSLIIRNYDFSTVFPSNYPSTYNVYASNLYCSLSIINGSTSPHLATFGLAIYSGQLAEQFVGQELYSITNNQLYYWARDAKNSSAEIDFLFFSKGNIYPIEVKDGPSGKLRSLHLYRKAYDPKYSIVFHAGEMGLLENEKIIFLPLYFVSSFTKYGLNINELK